MKASEASLASGPLHDQVMSAAQSGGGRILLELTPPEQGTIRIDLRIDQTGRAHLIVEGASDATKSRLDQGGQSLKNEFAQMGLNLSLDLRQDNQSQQAREQGFGNARQGFYNNPPPVSQRSDTTMAIGSVRSGDNREYSNTVHLYA
jgi:flagellar hook-length control protein FliK